MDNCAEKGSHIGNLAYHDLSATKARISDFLKVCLK